MTSLQARIQSLIPTSRLLDWTNILKELELILRNVIIWIGHFRGIHSQEVIWLLLWCWPIPRSHYGKNRISTISALLQKKLLADIEQFLGILALSFYKTPMGFF